MQQYRKYRWSGFVSCREQPSQSQWSWEIQQSPSPSYLLWSLYGKTIDCGWFPVREPSFRSKCGNNSNLVSTCLPSSRHSQDCCGTSPEDCRGIHLSPIPLPWCSEGYFLPRAGRQGRIQRIERYRDFRWRVVRSHTISGCFARHRKIFWLLWRLSLPPSSLSWLFNRLFVPSEGTLTNSTSPFVGKQRAHKLKI